MNRGLQVSTDATGGLASKGQSGDNLLQSIDSNRTVKGLCASNYYIAMDFFDTYTCNQLHHFGVKGVKRWVDSCNWEKNYEGFYDLNTSAQDEIRKSMSQASSTLLLRNWQEVSKLFVEYLQRSPTSPFCRVGGIFVRYEYQKDTGNLSHIHLILQVKWDELTPEEKELCKTSFAPRKMKSFELKKSRNLLMKEFSKVMTIGLKCKGLQKSSCLIFVMRDAK